MNLLSVGAAYGLIVLVFQKGGIGTPTCSASSRSTTIEAWLPLFLFSRPVRPLDGLPRLPAEPDPRALRPNRTTTASRWPSGCGSTGEDHHRRGADHGRGLRRLRHRAAGDAPADGLRAGGRRAARRDDRPLDPRAGEHGSCSATATGTCPRWLRWLPKIDVEGHDAAARVEVPDSPAELVEAQERGDVDIAARTEGGARAPSFLFTRGYAPIPSRADTRPSLTRGYARSPSGRGARASASRAIHRPLLVPVARIASASSIAAACRARSRLPIWRRAQFTAFLTSLRSSLDAARDHREVAEEPFVGVVGPHGEPRDHRERAPLS